jgi:hypothetical protein
MEKINNENNSFSEKASKISKLAGIGVIAAGLSFGSFKAGEAHSTNNISEGDGSDNIEFHNLTAGLEFEEHMPLIGSMASVDFERDNDGKPISFSELVLKGEHGIEETKTFKIDDKQILELALRSEAYYGGNVKLYAQRISDNEILFILDNKQDPSLKRVNIGIFNTETNVFLSNLEAPSIDQINDLRSPKITELNDLNK